MTQEQRNGLIREITFALLAALVSFNLFPESAIDVVGAAVVAVGLLIWGLAEKPTDGAAMGSMVRKAVQAIPPVLVQFAILTTEQGVTLTALAIAIVGAWSFKANKTNSQDRRDLGLK
jgi:hypothetical protein